MKTIDVSGRSARFWAMVVSLVVGVAVFILKFFAYRISDSAALQADAYESIVNCLAAAFGLFAVITANRPADDDHPYGHGKFEDVSAAVEAGSLAVAAIAIIYEAIRKIID